MLRIKNPLKKTQYIYIYISWGSIFLYNKQKCCTLSFSILKKLAFHKKSLVHYKNILCKKIVELNWIMNILFFFSSKTQQESRSIFMKNSEYNTVWEKKALKQTKENEKINAKKILWDLVVCICWSSNYVYIHIHNPQTCNDN